MGVVDRSELTVPSCLRLYQSKITDAGRGVWTNELIPINSLFGPYEGQKIRDAIMAEKSGYSWKVSCQRAMGDLHSVLIRGLAMLNDTSFKKYNV